MPRRRNQQLAEARRTEILAAAGRCFVRRGLHQASMRDILDEVGLSAGALYNYFDGKEAIIEAIAARERVGIEAVAAHLKGSDDIPRRILEAVSAIILETTPDDARLSLEFAAEASRNDKVRAILQANDKALRTAFLEALRRGRRRGEITPALKPKLLLETIVALYEGFIGRLALDESADAKEYAKAAVTILTPVLRGSGKGPQRK